MPTWRFQPYGTPSARLNEHTNANAGPSTLKPPLAPCVAPLITHPSEATTDAEQDRGIAKEDTALVSNSYCSYITHVIERSFGARQSSPQDNHARDVIDIEKISVSCVSGRKGVARTMRNSRVMKKLYAVSPDPIL